MKMIYPTWFYYFAAVTNLLMRLGWVINVFDTPAWYKQAQMDILILSVMEALRRAQWALLRIENEKVNNFERYRNILQIPEFDEELPKFAKVK